MKGTTAVTSTGVKEPARGELTFSQNSSLRHWLENVGSVQKCRKESLFSFTHDVNVLRWTLDFQSFVEGLLLPRITGETFLPRYLG